MRHVRVLLCAALLTSSAVVASADPGALCSWYLKTDADTLNIAFPDESATYWATELYAVPGTRVTVRGTYPQARYFSFHAYDLATRTVGSLADLDIDPDTGSGNPFRSVNADGDRRYTITIEFSDRPEDPAPNTLYVGATADGAPNSTGALIYRIYVADDPDDPAGNVGLPDVTIEGPAGSIPLPQCDPLPPSTGGALNGIERDSDFPDAAPRVVPLGNQYTNPPTTRRFYGLDRLVWDRVPPNAATDPLPRFKGTFYSNDQNAYLITRTSRQFGDVVAYRFKAPSFPDTRAGVPVAAPAQLRYWSLCQYDLFTQRYVACSADHQSVVGSDGYARFVIADPGDRPANATDADGVNWLAWGGPYYDGFIGYRQMLPEAGFTTTISHIAEGSDPRATMGDWWPDVAYCARTTIETFGFDACFDQGL